VRRGALGAGDQVGQQHVHQVQRVVDGGGLQVAGDRQQRRRLPVACQPRQGVRGGAHGVAGQHRQPARRHPGRVDVDLAGAEPAQLGHTVQRIDQPLGAHPGRCAAQPLQPRDAPGRLQRQQRRKAALQPRLALDQPGKAPPQPSGGLVTLPGDQPGQHARARQQHLTLQQPRGRPVEQHAGPLGAGPRPRPQPGTQLGLHRGVAEVAVAVDLADLAGVLMLGRQPGGVLLHTRRVGDPELGGKVLDHRPRHLQRVGQERAEEPHRGELDGKAEPVVLAAALGD
jgi:hypothetical protein